MGLTEPMRKLYAVVRGNGNTLRISLNGAEALFVCETPLQLRTLESSLLTERELLNALQQCLKPGDVFLDVGSNLGVFAVFGSKAVGPRGGVIAFEPCAGTFDQLRKTAALNQLHNLRCLQLALSDTSSTKKLVVNDADPFGLMAHLADAAVSSGEEVRTIRYDSLVQDDGFPIPRVVKMDVEGHEYAALQGMERTLSNPECTALLCEIHSYALPAGISLRDVVNLIESFGFRCMSTKIRSSEHQVIATKQAVPAVTIGNHAHADVAK